MRNIGRKISGVMYSAKTALFKLFILTVISLFADVLAWADVAPVLAIPDNPAIALKLPDGFKLNVFAKLSPAGSQYFTGARFMAFDSNGNLYISTGQNNRVFMLPDRNHDGVADEMVLVSDRLNAPQGLAFVGDILYVANQDGVVRLKGHEGLWPATEMTPVITNLPMGGHALKTLKLGPDGYLYLNVGSSCNVCQEEDPLRATILRFAQDGRPAGALQTLGRHAQSAIWAQGLRNSEGFAWQPETGAMFATNNSADMRSLDMGGKANDHIPPEHFNQIEAGHHYGWPYCWGDHVMDVNFPNEGFCNTMTAPVMTFPAHSAPLGVTFLDKAKLPSEYQNDAIVALHGSWNRRSPSGYKLVRVHFEQGKAKTVSDFVTGWLSENGAWGRPVDVVVGTDGAIYVSDDRAGLIYRIIYQGKTS